MVYYIEQTEGKKVEAARELGRALIEKDYGRAKDIYTAEMGSIPANHLENIEDNFSWWHYNARSNIRQNHAVWHLAMGKYKHALLNEQRWAYEKMAKMAEKKHGGKWEVVYEY